MGEDICQKTQKNLGRKKLPTGGKGKKPTSRDSPQERKGTDKKKGGVLKNGPGFENLLTPGEKKTIFDQGNLKRKLGNWRGGKCGPGKLEIQTLRTTNGGGASLGEPPKKETDLLVL